MSGRAASAARAACRPPSSKARRKEFRRAKRREERAHFAAQDDETGWYCAMGCGRLIEEYESGPYCRQCREYGEDYEAMMSAEFEREYLASFSDWTSPTVGATEGD